MALALLGRHLAAVGEVLVEGSRPGRRRAARAGSARAGAAGARAPRALGSVEVALESSAVVAGPGVGHSGHVSAALPRPWPAGWADVVDAPEPLGGDQRVHLGRGDRGVAEQLLHGPDVGAVVEHVGGARVAQHVRAEAVAEADPVAVGAHDCQAPWRAAAAALVQEHGLGVAPPGPPVRGQRGPPGRGRARRPGPRGRSGRCGTMRSLAPLPKHPQQAAVEVEVGRATGRPARRCAARCRRAPRGWPGRGGRRVVARRPRRAGASTSASVSALGRPAGTRGTSTSAAGSRVSWPSSARNRCSDRTATSARATDAGARPRPRS